MRSCQPLALPTSTASVTLYLPVLFSYVTASLCPKQFQDPGYKYSSRPRKCEPQNLSQSLFIPMSLVWNLKLHALVLPAQHLQHLSCFLPPPSDGLKDLPSPPPPPTLFNLDTTAMCGLVSEMSHAGSTDAGIRAWSRGSSHWTVRF